MRLRMRTKFDKERGAMELMQPIIDFVILALGVLVVVTGMIWVALKFIIEPSWLKPGESGEIAGLDGSVKVLYAKNLSVYVTLKFPEGTYCETLSNEQAYQWAKWIKAVLRNSKNTREIKASEGKVLSIERDEHFLYMRLGDSRVGGGSFT